MRTVHSLQGILAGFVQDDWRTRANLTFNLGIRWEHETPVTERFYRATGGFDPLRLTPLSVTAAAAYTKKPIPQVPSSQFQALGGLTFAGPGHPASYDTRSSIFSPRIGFAWSPRALGAGTVIRGGLGLFVTPVGISSSLALNQEGFSQTTQFVATTNNYLTPATTLSNPFPDGILKPTNGDPGTFLGQQIKFFNREFAIHIRFAGTLASSGNYLRNSSSKYCTSATTPFICSSRGTTSITC